MNKDCATISVIGLGYVGLPVAVAFARKFSVVAFDRNPQRIRQLKAGKDTNEQLDPRELKKPGLIFTADARHLSTADFHIVTVPTPLAPDNQPDLSCLEDASRSVGSILKKGDTVVYESTVYPGVTEDVCVPLLEKSSGLKYRRDFHVGYSPERINAGDKKHTFESICKVVAASSPAALERVAKTYGSVIKGGIHRVSSIKVAEAAKIIENTQRDLNIALMNEFALLLGRLGIDTHEVLEAARTKWNFMPFVPGLVGGHCIGVDSYYLAHLATRMGHPPQVILAGRTINEGMGQAIAEQAVAGLARARHRVRGAQATVLGMTFKENCKDIRNSKVFNVIRALQSSGVKVQVHDPIADADAVQKEYGITLTPWQSLKPAQVVIAAVSHDSYRRLTMAKLAPLLAQGAIMMDVKAIFDPGMFARRKIHYWRL